MTLEALSFLMWNVLGEKEAKQNRLPETFYKEEKESRRNGDSSCPVKLRRLRLVGQEPGGRKEGPGGRGLAPLKSGRRRMCPALGVITQPCLRRQRLGPGAPAAGGLFLSPVPALPLGWGF